MSKNPAKKMITAPRKNLPTAKHAAAPKFTTSPRNVKKLGLIPVAAIAPTIFSSSHLLPVPIAPVRVAIFWRERACYFANIRVNIVTQARCCRKRAAGQFGFATHVHAAFHRFFGIDVREVKEYSRVKSLFWTSH